MLRKPPDLGLGRGQFLLDGKEPRHHPLHIAVDRRGRRVERDGSDRGGGVGPDTGQRAELGFAPRELPAVALDHGLGAGVQIACARVVAEPGPELEHVVERRRCQRPHITASAR